MSIYLIISIISLVSRVILEVSYERFKRKNNYKNTYIRGEYLFAIKKSPVLGKLVLVLLPLIPFCRYSSIIDLIAFKNTFERRLNNEIEDNDVIKVISLQNEDGEESVENDSFEQDENAKIEHLTGEVVDKEDVFLEDLLSDLEKNVGVEDADLLAYMFFVMTTEDFYREVEKEFIKYHEFDGSFANSEDLKRDDDPKLRR